MRSGTFREHLSHRLLMAPAQGKRDYANQVNLTSNELHHPELETLVREFLSQCTVESVRKYPYFPGASKAICEQLGLRHTDVLLTAGSDDAIRMVVYTLAATTGRLLLLTPAYANYESYARGAGIQVETINFQPGGLHAAVEQLSDAILRAPPSTVALANPNGFDGEVIPPPIVELLAERSAAAGHILVIDEAYSAFSNVNHLDLAESFENLILLRSFSKSHGAAGLRVGLVVTSSILVNYLARWKPSNPVSALALDYLRFCNVNHERFAGIWRDISSARDQLADRVRESRPAWRVSESHANFCLIELEDTHQANAISEDLEGQGILVRTFEDLPGWDSCIRITTNCDVHTQLLPTLVGG